jgi:thymidylate kinase
MAISKKDQRDVEQYSEKQIEVFNNLINLFQKNRICYCIVGDTRLYPGIINGDIDIVVSNESFKGIPLILQKFCKQHQLILIQALQHEQTAIFFIITWIDEANRIKFLHPDVCTDYIRFGRHFLSAKELLEDRRISRNSFGDRGNFYVPSPSHSFIYYFIKKVEKGYLNKHHADYLRSEWEKDPFGVQRQIRRFWPGNEGDIIIKAVKNNDWATINNNILKLNSSLHSILRFSFSMWIRELIRKTKRFLQPTGVFVVFLGADGSGKSTIISKVRKSLAPAFRHTKHYHFRPHLISRKKNKRTVINPHYKEPLGIGTSTSKLFLYLIDYIIGYMVKIYIELVQSTLVIFDRYSYDILVDPKRYRYGGPIILLKLINSVIPAPKLIILLDASAETLMARKQEVPFNELVRQRDAYLNLMSRLPKGYIINASRPIDKVVCDVEQIILEYMANRIVRRLRLKRLL